MCDSSVVIYPFAGASAPPFRTKTCNACIQFSHLFFCFVAVRLLRLPLVSTAAGVGPPLTYMHQPWSLEILILDSQPVSVLRWNWKVYLWKHVHRPHAMFDFHLDLLFALSDTRLCANFVSSSRSFVFPVHWARVTQNRVLVTSTNPKAKLQSLSTTPFSRCF